MQTPSRGAVPVTTDAERSKYRNIADDLRKMITGGTYGAGDRIPGENELMARYGVARMTARAALTALRDEGLTVTRKGAGVFVRDFQPIKRRSIDRLSAQQWGTGSAIWDADTAERQLVVDQLQVHSDIAPAHLASMLSTGDEPVPVLIRSRRYVLDGKPVMTAASYLPAGLVAGSPITEPDPGPGGIYARLSDLGHAPTRFVEQVRSRMPNPDEVEALELMPGTPVILIQRTAYTADDVVVEVNEMTLDGSAYILEYAFRA